jgi:hypothetical protein
MHGVLYFVAGGMSHKIEKCGPAAIKVIRLARMNIAGREGITAEIAEKRRGRFEI